MERYRAKITTPLGEFYALPINKLTLTKDLIEEDSGGRFYRTKLSQCRYSNKSPENAFNQFKTLEQSINRCEECFFDLEMLTSSGWENKFAGVFTMASFTFNYDNCTCSFTPEVNDDYRCVLREYDVEYDMLSEPTPVTIKDVQTAVIDNEAFQYEWYVTDGTAGDEPYNQGEIGYDPVNQVTVDFGGNTYQIFWRAIVVVDCIAGSCALTATFVIASGIIADLDLLGSDCDGAGTCTYTITDITSDFTDMSYIGSFDISDFSVSATESDPNTNNQLIASLIYASEYLFYITPTIGGATEFDNGRLLSNVLTFLLNKSCDSVTTVKSNFFRINPDGVASVLPSTDHFKNLALYQIGDVITPGADTNSTRAMISLKALLTNICKVFNMRWKIEGSELIIEHVSDLIPSTENDLTAITGHRQFTYKGSEVPKRHEFSFTQQRNVDFVGADIVYTGGCVGDATKKTTVSGVVTDLLFVQAYPSSISVDSIFLMKFADGGAFNEVKISEGKISGILVKNADLGWANLHDLLYRHEMFDSEATMNNESITATSVIKIRESKINHTDCDLVFNPENVIVTELGSGEVQSHEVEIATLRASTKYLF